MPELFIEINEITKQVYGTGSVCITPTTRSLRDTIAPNSTSSELSAHDWAVDPARLERARKLYFDSIQQPQMEFLDGTMDLSNMVVLFDGHSAGSQTTSSHSLTLQDDLTPPSPMSLGPEDNNLEMLRMFMYNILSRACETEPAPRPEPVPRKSELFSRLRWFGSKRDLREGMDKVN